MINIRPAKVSDAEALIHLFSALDMETDFMLMEPDERNQSPGQQRAILERFSNPATGLFLVAEDDHSKRLIGFIVGTAGTAKRNQHCISLVIGILQHYSGKGLGKQMVKHHIDWSMAHHFHRIELTVMSHNERALHLYKKFQFEIEGTKKDALKINGKYVNEFYMSRVL